MEMAAPGALTKNGVTPPTRVVMAPRTRSPDTATSRGMTALPVTPKLNAVGAPAELSAFNRTVPPAATAARTLVRSVGKVPVGTTTWSGNGAGPDLATATAGSVAAASEVSAKAARAGTWIVRVQLL